MASTRYLIIAIAIMAIITALLRYVPFLLFGKGQTTPKLITYLGKYLPYSIMGMLVVYCIKDVNFAGGSHGLPELISIVLVAVLHAWKNNTLLSIISGTICYMLLVQIVFA